MAANAQRRFSPAWPAGSRLCGALAFAVALVWAADARADDASEFEYGQNSFDAGRYAEAAKRFEGMLDPAAAACGTGPSSGRCRLTDPDFIERARALYASSLIALKRINEADALIETIFLQNPAYQPNPAVFPSEVIDRFTEVKGKIKDKIDAVAKKKAEEAMRKRLTEQKARDAERDRIKLLERLAGTERVVDQNSRLIALVPFGVGQFQNGDTAWGFVFGVSQALTGGASILTAVIADNLSAVDITKPDPETGNAVQTDDLRTQRAAVITTNRIMFAIWAASTVVGVVQAQIAFVPERVTYRPRPIPNPPSVAPTVSLGPGGAAFGVVGRF